MKTCITCQWFEPSRVRPDRTDLACCLHPSRPKDPVSGERVTTYCDHARSDDSCGPKGLLWEERPPRLTLADRVRAWWRAQEAA